MAVEIDNDLSKNVFSTSTYLLVFRAILISVLAFLGYVHLFRRFKRIKDRNVVVNKLPGPPSFNPLMGNLPLEVLMYVGADYEASKHLYSSEY